MSIFTTQNFIDELNSQLDNALDNESKVHISVKQRTTRKKNTIIENLDTNPVVKKSKKTPDTLIATMRKKFNCGGHLETDTNERVALVFTGDVKQVAKDFLKKEFGFEDSNFVIHG
jgi:translation initiation factor 1 (eIF-1/SUI1)